MKADFIPQLEDEEDTSYFDMRSERYNHEVEELDETRSSAEDTDDTQSLFASFTSGKFYSLLLIFTQFYSISLNYLFIASPRYRRAHDSSSSLIEHRHSMSICESTSSQSSDQSSESSASSGISKTSPELRLRPKSTSEKSAHLSCPDLETMVTKNSSQCMTIPNRAIEPKKNVSETDSEDPGKVSFSRKKQ